MAAQCSGSDSRAATAIALAAQPRAPQRFAESPRWCASGARAEPARVEPVEAGASRVKVARRLATFDRALTAHFFRTISNRR